MEQLNDLKSTEAFTPDFFIIGFSKCGTTSLANYLNAIDGIVQSDKKEPHYFTKEYPTLRSVDNDADYGKLFESASNGDLTFEASTRYAYSASALDTILRRNPAAKLILCLRDPVQMALSLHTHALRQYYDDVENPVDAWNLQEERKLAPDYGAKHGDDVSQYRHWTSTGDHFERIVEIVPRDQIFTVFLEDMASQEHQILQDLSVFLGRGAVANGSMPKSNQGRLYRSKLLYFLHTQTIRKGLFLKTRKFLKEAAIKQHLKRILFTRPPDKNSDAHAQFAKITQTHRITQLEKIRDAAVSIGHHRTAATAERLLGS